MLDYEWGNPSTIMLSGEEPEPPPGSDPSNHNFLHHYTSTAPTAFGDNLLAPTQPTSNDPTTTNHFAHHFEPQSQGHHHIQNNFYDPRVYPGASNYAPHHSSMLSLDPGFMMLPKSEENIGRSVDFTSRIGLNLGGRTYFSSEDDFMSRLYRRTRPLEPGTNNLPRCQAEGCNADLSHAKHYHRRHKVCEFHSKASTVIAAGLTQRFCQQCSRFHLLSEFDNGKRSCRKRLADHNRRRRKTQQSNHENPKSQVETARNSSSDHMNGSPSDSGAHSSCSVTIAVSPPGITFDGFRQRPYQTSGAARSSSSTGSSISSSLFFSK